MRISWLEALQRSICAGNMRCSQTASVILQVWGLVRHGGRHVPEEKVIDRCSKLTYHLVMKKTLEFDLAKPEQLRWFTRLISELQGNLINYDISQTSNWVSIHIL